MKTSLALIAVTATIVVGTLAPSAAIPDPDRLGSATERTTTSSFPFDAGSAPLRHVDGNDWLPSRRWG